MASRDFDAEREQVEPHEIKLGGRTIRLMPFPPQGTFLDGRSYDGAQGVIDFLRMVIMPEDREAFEELLIRPDVFVPQADFAKVSVWYAEVVSGRPTNGSSPSGAGPDATPPTSKARRSSRAKAKA